jgi:hypothetical protein
MRCDPAVWFPRLPSHSRGIVGAAFRVTKPPSVMYFCRVQTGCVVHRSKLLLVRQVQRRVIVVDSRGGSEYIIGVGFNVVPTAARNLDATFTHSQGETKRCR